MTSLNDYLASLSISGGSLNDRLYHLDDYLAATYLQAASAYAAATTDVLTAKVTGDTVNRFVINADGTIEWGPGNAALDTNLYRVAGGYLKSNNDILSANSFVAFHGLAGQTDIGAVGPAAEAGIRFGSTSDTRLYRSAADSLRTDDSLLIASPAAAAIALTVKAAAAQTGNLQEWQDSAGTMLAKVTAAGAAQFAGLTLTDATDVALGSTTGTKIGTATTQKLGFYNAAPIVQPSAYTQTYATASKTHAARTSAAVSTTGATNTVPYGYTTAAQANAIVTAINAIRADLDSTAQVVNQLVDDLQALGLVA